MRTIDTEEGGVFNNAIETNPKERRTTTKSYTKIDLQPLGQFSIKFVLEALTRNDALYWIGWDLLVFWFIFMRSLLSLGSCKRRMPMRAVVFGLQSDLVTVKYKATELQRSEDCVCVCVVFSYFDDVICRCQIGNGKAK